MKGDTLVTIPVEKVRLINKTFKERDFYKYQYDSLFILTTIQSESIDFQIGLNRKLNERNIELLDRYSDQQKMINSYVSMIDYYDRSLNNEKRRTLKFAIGGTVVGVSIGTIAVLLLMN
ncbi:MAG: hypothetical protein M0R03_18990 [Novosphingobium sp.]|nr:hypothetical protein [Novosphingobium sp.]